MEKESRVKTARLAKGLAGTMSLFIDQQTHIARALAMNFRSFGGMDIGFFGGASIDKR